MNLVANGGGGARLAAKNLFWWWNSGATRNTNPKNTPKASDWGPFNGPEHLLLVPVTARDVIPW
jgi:hypothetical protein